MAFVPVGKKEIEGPDIEPGRYLARIEKANTKKSQAQNNLLLVHWTLVGDQPPAGQRILDNFTLIPEAYWKLNLMMQAVGYEPGEDGFDTDGLIGLECYIALGKESDEQGGRMRVNGYFKEAE